MREGGVVEGKMLSWGGRGILILIHSKKKKPEPPGRDCIGSLNQWESKSLFRQKGLITEKGKKGIVNLTEGERGHREQQRRRKHIYLSRVVQDARAFPFKTFEKGCWRSFLLHVFKRQKQNLARFV